MDLWQLKIFCKVVELKSFSKAGEAVYLSQPTVSSHIKDLENHLETQLVDRLARSVVPTKAGELLYGYARRLIDLRREAESAMAEFLGKMKGRLTVGGSTIPGGYLLPRLLGGFAQLYPEVQVSLIVGDTAEIIQRISQGEIEIGLVGARDKDQSQLHQTAVIADKMVVVLPADHKWADREFITYPELSGEPFILRERGSGTLRAIETAILRAGQSMEGLHIVARMGSTEAVRQGIKYKLGISILSAIAVADEVAAGTLKTLTLKGISLKRSFYLTRHRLRTPSPLCRAFNDFVQSRFGQDAVQPF